MTALSDTKEIQVNRSSRLIQRATFEVSDLPIGEPGIREARIKVLACGVCASERHAVESEAGPFPMSLGHEPVGLINAVGPDVDQFSVGMRVTGGVWPSFADYVVADVSHLVEVPEELETYEAIGEPLGCVVEGRRRTRVEFGDRVAVVGGGYMGLLMLQLLLTTGAGRVTVLDPRLDAREKATSLGATDVGDPSEAAGLAESFDVVVEASGTQPGLDLSTTLVREHGVLSILGYHVHKSREVDMQTWNWKAIDVINAHVRRRDYLNSAIERGLEMTRLGRIDPGGLVTHEFDLDHVGEAFEALATKPEGFIKAVVAVNSK